MKRMRFVGMASSLVLFLFLPVTHARADGGDVYWRTNPYVKSCSMVIDPSLTQGQWGRFVRQASAIVSSKSLGSAETLGRMHFKVGITASNTPVDQHDLAWINTFTHPSYRNCPLGDDIRIPTIRAAMGITDRLDAGAFWTTAPDANYGLVGAELKYAFVKNVPNLPAAAVRASTTILTGVPDFNISIYSVDLIASKRVAVFTPYVGFKQSLAVGTETTSKVDLDRESIGIAQGYAGVAYSVWKVSLAAEYNFSAVNTLALSLGMAF